VIRSRERGAADPGVVAVTLVETLLAWAVTRCVGRALAPWNDEARYLRRGLLGECTA